MRNRQCHRANAIRIVARILPVIVLIVLAASLTACDTSSDGEPYDPYEPGGFGVTYNGKPGIDLGSGLVLDPGKGTVSPGYGF